jgi:hypothetical protein
MAWIAPIRPEKSRQVVKFACRNPVAGESILPAKGTTAMNAIFAERLVDDGPATDLEGEIKEFVRRDAPFLRRPQPEAGGEANNVSSLIQRVAGTSMNEIERLIAQLQDMRDFLQIEGERIQREIAGYALLSQTARTHIETLSDHMAQWKAGTAHPRV